MAYPTAVNSQITDALTQQSVTVLAQAPAIAMATVYQSAAHSIGILMQNATLAQRHGAIAGQAATNQGVVQLYAMPSMTGALAARKIQQSQRSRDLLTAAVLLKLLS